MKTINQLFAFEPSDDPTLTDDQYVLRSNTDITIQVCEDGGYVVNKWMPTEKLMWNGPVTTRTEAFQLALTL